MTHHHPDSQWLIEYAAGTLSESQALCVSTHLKYCSRCRAEVAKLNNIGAGIFSDQPFSDCVDPQLFSSIMKRIGAQSGVDAPEPASTRSSRISQLSESSQIPAFIGKLIPEGEADLQWKKLGKSVRIANLMRLDEDRDISLHKLLPGGTVAEHDHAGQEITVVLCGSFSDQNGTYKAGDFVVKQPGDTHRPMVTGDEECICLTVCDAPVKFTGMLTRLLNPLVAYQHKH